MMLWSPHQGVCPDIHMNSRSASMGLRVRGGHSLTAPLRAPLPRSQLQLQVRGGGARDSKLLKGGRATRDDALLGPEQFLGIRKGDA